MKDVRLLLHILGTAVDNAKLIAIVRTVLIPYIQASSKLILIRSGIGLRNANRAISYYVKNIKNYDVS